MLDLPENPRVLIVGDSFAQGFGAEPQSAGYAYQLGGLLGWNDVTVDHEGRTGFTRDNNGLGENYGTRIANRIEGGEPAPDVVILQGTINDNSVAKDEMQFAIEAVVDTIRAGWPDTDIVLTYPITWRDSADQTTAIKSVATSAGTVLITDDGNWRQWRPKGSDLFAEDGWHPNTAGHAEIAKLFAEALRTRGA